MSTDMTLSTQAPEEMALAEQSRQGAWYVPPVDITEDFDEIRVVASMPGVLQEDLMITFERDVLKIQGRVRETDANVGEYVRREFAPGGYERSFHIGEVIDRDRITAEYSKGVLTLRLPKSEAAKPRTIPVSAG